MQTTPRRKDNIIDFESRLTLPCYTGSELEGLILELMKIPSKSGVNSRTIFLLHDLVYDYFLPIEKALEFNELDIQRGVVEVQLDVSQYEAVKKMREAIENLETLHNPTPASRGISKFITEQLSAIEQATAMEAVERLEMIEESIIDKTFPQRHRFIVNAYLNFISNLGDPSIDGYTVAQINALSSDLWLAFFEKSAKTPGWREHLIDQVILPTISSKSGRMELES